MISRRPSPPLDAFVERLWWSDRMEPFSGREHMLPTGNAQLVIALHDESMVWLRDRDGEPNRWTRGIVHGPHTSYFVSGPKPAGAVAGVAFRPGAAGAILGVPASDLTDRHVMLDELWGLWGRELHERLTEAHEPAAVFALLERALLGRLRSPLLMHPAVAGVLRTALWHEPVRVEQIERDAGYSARHFIALFRAAVGLTPKRYLLIRRFGAALPKLASAGDDSLAAIAAEAGYADQSHFSHEFRRLAGVVPSRYRPRDPASVHHHVDGPFGDLRGSSKKGTRRSRSWTV